MYLQQNDSGLGWSLQIAVLQYKVSSKVYICYSFAVVFFLPTHMSVSFSCVKNKIDILYLNA